MGCKCFVLDNGKENLGKLTERSDEGVFVCYSTSSKVYRVLKKRTQCIEESVHVIFDESSELQKLNDPNEVEFEELL